MLVIKIVAFAGLNFVPIAKILPGKVLIDILEVSIAQTMGEKVVGTITTELDQRMKEMVTGDKDYQFGDITKKALTGDKSYKFGDITRQALLGKKDYEFGGKCVDRTFRKSHRSFKPYLIWSANDAFFFHFLKLCRSRHNKSCDIKIFWKRRKRFVCYLQD